MHHDVTAERVAERGRLREEKLEGVLEMAGAVCHELNQPLQIASVHADSLLERLASNGSLEALARELKVNVDKMVVITKKLQHITAYETKDYVGGKKIIDIDKAAGV